MAGTPPDLTCSPVEAFDTADIDTVRSALKGVPGCGLRQAWNQKPSPAFSPAEVWIGWRDETLLVFAELQDTNIHTTAASPNQRLWELGDAFEIFLRPEDREAYVELQVAPNNLRLQLRYENQAALAWARAQGSLKDALLPVASFGSRTWIEQDHSRWSVLVEVPATLVCGSPTPRPGAKWRFSFSRYDHTPGGPPVLSSTSPHQEIDFHRQQDWGTITFEI